MSGSDFYTSGKMLELLSATVGASFTKLRKAIEAAGVAPEFTLNGIAYYSAESVDIVHGQLVGDGKHAAALLETRSE